jgi:hypothetical protein
MNFSSTTMNDTFLYHLSGTGGVADAAAREPLCLPVYAQEISSPLYCTTLSLLKIFYNEKAQRHIRTIDVRSFQSLFIHYFKCEFNQLAWNRPPMAIILQNLPSDVKE